jgi:excisionase family DNA binding protein
MTPANEPERLLTVPEVMALLRLSRTKLYEECKANKLRCARIGRSVRFKAGWVAEYVDSVATGVATARRDAGAGT